MSKVSRRKKRDPQKKAAFEALLEAVHSDQFKTLVELNGLAYLLWDGKKPKHEKAAQKVFFGVAHTYCRANNLDVSPEADAGRGPVDFKFSSGCRVLVEVKLSKNTKLVEGFAKQLPIYAEAEESRHGYLPSDRCGKCGKEGRTDYKTPQ